ncbi:inactive hydroxysteroid dehydrogenase-like protein 1 [Penaeus japonicus]|uniref:inactive hydroxysteroid dehydrogenase-like protein 1 n=1 Tax=Penaeus japonicus TaxID=27405 RepID=UPI001C70DDF2|nr:inactive hydroxysteroid dehydrogenase-like protein 1 [Penaeus japonicus]
METGDFQLFPYPNALLNIITLVGLLSVVKFVSVTTWNLAVGLRAHVWSKMRNKNFVATYGKWAVVTGSSDGIGEAYAHELAKKGMNLLLISRTMEKLQKVKEEIDKESGVEVEIMQVDFSHGKHVYEEIEERIRGKEIGLLVNNVAVILPYPMDFCEVNDHQLWSHVNVNVASPLAMTRMILPAMLERCKGAIVNIASIYSRYPVPMMQIYSASKAFVEFFSVALEAEYDQSGVTIQTITPAYVSTNMTKYSEKIHKPRFFVPTASNFAAHAVDTLGYTRYTTGYWTHGIQAWIFDTFIPRWIWVKLLKMKNQDWKKDMKKTKGE